MTPTLTAALIVAVQVATGAAWWILIRRNGPISVLELVGLGTALGTFGAMLSGILLVTTPVGGVGWLLPSVLAAVTLVVVRLRGGLDQVTITWPRWQLLALGVGLAGGVAILAVTWRQMPLVAPDASAYSDLYFFEALSRGLAQFGPRQSILMVDGSLRYHWFAYAWAGLLARSAGTGPFETITRVLPVVTLVGASAITAAWSGRLSRVRWVPTLAVLLVVVGGYSGALYGSILNFESPSQALATVWLLAFALVFVHLLTVRWSGLALILLAALASACTGGKASHALVLTGGVGLTVVVGLVARTEWRARALLAGAVAAVAVVATYVAVLSGVAIDQNLTESVAVKASTWQGLDPATGAFGVALGTAALLLAILARLAGLGLLWGSPRFRIEPSTLFATGGVIVGVAAMLLLREGVNELWFILAASAPAAVLSAVGAGRALRRLGRRTTTLPHPLLWAIGVAVPASVACAALSRNWTTNGALLNWLAPIAVWVIAPLVAVLVLGLRRAGLTVSGVLALSATALVLTSILTRPTSIWTGSRVITTASTTAVTADGTSTAPDAPMTNPLDTVPTADRYAAWQAGAAWVAENTGVDTVLATSNPPTAEVPALTGRNMFLAGQPYQVGLGRPDDVAVVSRRSDATQEFLANPGPVTAQQLCDADVEYFWMERGPDGIPSTAVAFATAGLTIVRLPGWACR